LSDSQQPAEQVEPNLPEGAKEETKEQFEKLKEHNRQMAQKLEEYERQQPKFSSVLDEVQPPSKVFGNLSTSQVADITQSLVDSEGYIDQNLLTNTLNEQNQRAQRAEDRAMLAEQRIEKFEETQLVRDVHSKHPQLDPYNPNFSREFYDKVKDTVLKQLKRGYQDYEAAANQVAAELKATSQEVSKAQTVKEEEAKKVISQREQASAKTGVRAPNQAEYDSDEEGLRKGDALSIGRLLKANGY